MKTVTTSQLLTMRRDTANYPHSERVAYKAQQGWDFTVKQFRSREVMARIIRNEQEQPTRYDNWVALIPLTPGEGY